MWSSSHPQVTNCRISLLVRAITTCHARRRLATSGQAIPTARTFLRPGYSPPIPSPPSSLFLLLPLPLSSNAGKAGCGSCVHASRRPGKPRTLPRRRRPWGGRRAERDTYTLACRRASAVSFSYSVSDCVLAENRPIRRSRV